MALMQYFSTSLPGLDWSEDSADDADNDEEEAEICIPFQSSWKPQNGSVSWCVPQQFLFFPFSLRMTTIIFFLQKGWKKTTVPREERGYSDSARISGRNISTCAGRRGQVFAKRDIAMPSVKPCCMLPVTTPTVLGSWSRSCVVSLKAHQGIVKNFLLVSFIYLFGLMWIQFV